jgi:Cu-Zn family superoxide dismutase
MKKFKQIINFGSFLLVSSIFFIACNEAGDNKESDNTDMKIEESSPATAVLNATTTDTALTGTADFMAEDGKVTLSLSLSIPALANKSVAVHIHEMGDCGEMGKGAHGHWNPTNQEHGNWGVGSFHSGDIGNVSLDAAGNGTMNLETDLWTIGGDEKTNILNRSIIVHSGTDDFTSQPSGNAGSRIGCGIIDKK